MTAVDDDLPSVGPSVGPPVAEREQRSSRRAVYLTAVLVAVPFVVAIVSVVGKHWHPPFDQALEILRIRAVGTSDTPLLGAWSRWGWQHPGPALFWVLAPFERLFGATGVLVGMGLVNLGCALGVVFVANRRGGRHFAVLAGLMVMLLTNSLGLTFLIDPWNPFAGFFPFVFFLILAWAVMSDDLAMAPLLVVVGSFTVQAHVGFLPLVLGLSIMAFAFAAAHVRHAPPGEKPGRWLVWAAVAGLVMWLPTIIEQLTGDPGNLTAMFDYAKDPSEPEVGWTQAWGVLGTQLEPIGAWLTNREIDVLGFEATSAVAPALVTVAVVAGTGWWARRRGQCGACRLALVALVGCGLALWATARVTGFLAPYVLRWWWGIAAVAFLSIVWSLVSASRSAKVQSVVGTVALCAMAVYAVVAVANFRAPMPVENVSQALSVLDDATAAGLDRDARYIVQGMDTRTWDAASSGLVADLDERGYNVFAGRSEITDLQFPSRFLASPETVDGIVTVVAYPELDAGWQPLPGSRVIASYDPLTPEERAHFRELEARIKTSLGDEAPPRVLLDSPYSRGLAVNAGASPADVAEFHEIQPRADGFVVYLAPVP